MFALKNMVVFFGVFVVFVAADSHVSLYQHSNHQGERAYIRSGGECRDVPDSFNDRASSLDTNNTCMRVFKDRGCRGDSFDYSPGRGSHKRLSENGFNDNISSVRAC